MLRRLRTRLTYANVTSSLALFLVVAGGGAYASHELINSSDVVDNSLTSADIQNLTLTTNDLGVDSVWGSRIRDDGVLSNHVVDNTLTGNDIVESTLRAARTVDRSRQTAGSVSSDTLGEEVPVPLTANTWTQLNDETDLFYGQATVTAPATCAGGSGLLQVKLDGAAIVSTVSFATASGTVCAC